MPSLNCCVLKLTHARRDKNNGMHGSPGNSGLIYCNPWKRVEVSRYNSSSSFVFLFSSLQDYVLVTWTGMDYTKKKKKQIRGGLPLNTDIHTYIYISLDK